MKTIKHILALIIAVGTFASCTDWLTVVPKSVYEASEVMKTNEGVRQALNGSYQDLKNTYAPTGRMGGAGVPELLACSYNTPAATIGPWRIHDYTDGIVENANEYLFQMQYNTIAGVNAVINGMEPNKDVLDNTTYNIVRGEALGIRALVHFDLLRLYGPVPYNPDPSGVYLPYIKVNGPNNYPYHTFEEFSEFVLADLDEAERLLEEYDPVVSEPLTITEVDYYEWQHRKSHMNYYGVLGLQARARLWFGDEEGALRYAKMVIEAEEPDGSGPKFRLTTEADLEKDQPWSDDRSYYTEHLTGTKHLEYDIYASSSDPWRAMTYSNNASDFASKFSVDGLGISSPDIRIKGNDYNKQITYFMQYTAGGRPLRYTYGTNKFAGYFTNSNSPKNFPIIRLAEMYFIVMELGTLAEANAAYEEYCAARSIPFTALTEVDRQGRLLAEFIREFYSESQNFFRYKRTGAREMMFADPDTEIAEEQYRFPLPLRETSNLQ